jgi:hypothetical protein
MTYKGGVGSGFCRDGGSDGWWFFTVIAGWLMGCFKR